MVSARLRSDIGFCRFATCTIVLDIAADRYWRLDAEAGSLFDAIAAAGELEIDSADAERLAAAGFLTSAGRSFRFPSAPMPPTPATSAIETQDGDGAGYGTAGEIGTLILWWRLAVRTRRLSTHLERQAARKAMLSSTAPSSDIVHLARTFRYWRRIVPLKPLCLPDSLALMTFLMRRGHQPTLIFGVEAYPFSAHCWLQQGTMVLNDAVGHTTLFQPILAI
jgi:hypothetical protein